MKLACLSLVLAAVRGLQPPPYVERGVALRLPSESFFREESALSRDLAVLAASLVRAERAPPAELSVLDVMASTGARAARYLAHAGATRGTRNEANEDGPRARRSYRTSRTRAAAARGAALAVSHEDWSDLLHARRGARPLRRGRRRLFGLGFDPAAALWCADPTARRAP